MALAELLNRPDTVIEDVAFAIARDEYPAFALERGHDLLSRMADEVKNLSDEVAPCDALGRVIHERYRFEGNADNYYDRKNSYLNDVLSRRRGIPISLAVVWMAVGRRAGLSVHGVSFPGHFLVEIGDEAGAAGRFVDVFSGGRELDHHQLVELAKRVTSDPEPDLKRCLRRATLHEMATRILYNLKNVHERSGDHGRALLVCDRLVNLARDPFLRRDRGLHALALGAHGSAEADLSDYLRLEPDAPDALHVRTLLSHVNQHDRSLLN